MEGRRISLLLLLVVCLTAWPAVAAAKPVEGPHGTIEQRFTTIRPNAPAGWAYSARYYGAGDENAPPPYMRRMIAYNPSGFRRDTSVPERCTASDTELALRGPDACPEGSKLAAGSTMTSFNGGSPMRSELHMFNNTREQIILGMSPFVVTVIRGKLHADGSVEFASPTCYPALQPVGCPVDTVLQLASSVAGPAYTKRSGGKIRSYLTTPRKCPRTRRWLVPFRFWWADGTVDTVVTKHRCSRTASPS